MCMMLCVKKNIDIFVLKILQNIINKETEACQIQYKNELHRLFHDLPSTAITFRYRQRAGHID